MPWAYVASDSLHQGGSMDLTLNKPAGTADGDLLVAFISYIGSPTPAIPAGWSQAAAGQIGGNAAFLWVYWKIASSEPSNWTWLQSGGNPYPYQGSVHDFTGIDGTGLVIDGVAGDSGSGLSMVADSVTTTAADDLVLRAVQTWNAGTVVLDAGLTQLANFGSGGDVQAVGAQNATAAGATGTSTSAQDVSDAYASMTIAFLESGTGGGGSGSHTGLTGAGVIPVSTPAGVKVTMSGVPSGSFKGFGNPERVFNCGSLSFSSDGTYASRNYFIEHASELIVMPHADVNWVFYSFAPGITATIDEVVVL